MPLYLSTHPKINDIYQTGIRENYDLKTLHVKSAYMNEEIFYYYISEILVPYVNNKRENLKIKKEKAVLLMDNLSSHISDRVMEELSPNNIYIITFPPHTSHIFQVLDVSIFGILKNYLKSLPHKASLHVQVDLCWRTFRAFELATCSTTIRSAFEKTGFIIQHTNSKKIEINEEKIRNSSDFKELFQKNIQIENISQRRRSAKWGFVNQRYFLLEKQNEEV
ncbi:hypothetical protein TRFO_22367 [Tritrichomonas foetus]|uniref:DDE-1 domain-containing protein n=1 Tax=Tritrichomonas foetus TaxID=1144522 RepID=A0A1J4KH17_9EUKA|nr:hypothetical protein TRFO_22367 [Tritrichomonas foetus]|eukprot:OHT08942.1 hypothetical protein TRFO_22367 [Tritrichomonas foetus]